MREIKFRAWDKELERMCKVLSIDLKNKRIVVYHELEDHPSNWLKLDRFILMQYTCKKDKNDKEIYEDDIVETELFGSAGYDTETFIGIVKFDKVRSEYRVINDKGYQILGYNEWVKLGNKYENPELLEGDINGS